MQKNRKYVCAIVIFMFLIISIFSPVKINALSINNVENNININYITNVSNISFFNNLEVRHSLDGCGDSLLGNPNDENSVAWLLQTLLNYIKVIGPILVIVLSSVDFLKVIVKSDDDAMAGATKKLGYRSILAALLFFIPTIVTAILIMLALSAMVS